MPDLLGLATLVGVTLVAATVNGALGYGFSSMTVPVALVDGALLYNFFTRTGARRDGAATRDWSVRGRASLGPGDTPPVWVRETRHG